MSLMQTEASQRYEWQLANNYPQPKGVKDYDVFMDKTNPYLRPPYLINEC